MNLVSINGSAISICFSSSNKRRFLFGFNSYLLVCFSEALALESPRMDVQNSTIPGSTPGSILFCNKIISLASALPAETQVKRRVHKLYMWGKTDSFSQHWNTTFKKGSAYNFFLRRSSSCIPLYYFVEKKLKKGPKTLNSNIWICFY